MASSQHTQTKLFAFLVIWIASILLASLVFHFEWLKKFEYTSWDWRLQAVARPQEIDPRVKIIMIDESSLEYFAKEGVSWPWPRSLYNPLLTYLKKAGAKGVAFDMLYIENLDVAFDQEFAAAVADSLPVVSAMAVRPNGTEDEGHDKKNEMLRQQVSQAVPYAEKFLSGLNVPEYRFVALPYPELLEASPGLGNVRSLPDSDEIYRRIFPGAYVDKTPVLNLAFALFHLTHPDSQAGEEIKRFADNSGQYLVRFRGPAGTYKHYPIAAMISSGVQIMEQKEPLVPIEEFKDSFVFIGSNASALLDLRPVPFSGTYPGVEVHASILDNILHQDFFREVPRGLGIVAGSLMLLLVSYVAMYGGRLQAPVLVTAYAAWLAICLMAAQMGWWLPQITPLFGMIFATVACLGFQYSFEGRQHRFIKNAFQYYVTPEVIDKIVADPSRLSLGGERRDLTIFFSDIAGFTTLSEKMEPSKLVQFLNKFLSEMTDIILNSGGTIDKYEGDAIIAFWNAPLSVPDHQLRGVKAALQCQRRLHDLAGYFDSEFGVEVKMRVGLNTGAVTVGNFGSSTRFNYTMIGDAANLASRLEGANKVFGSSILVSDTTQVGAVEGIVWRKLGDIRVVGKNNVVPVFEPLDSVVHSRLLSQIVTYRAAIAAFEALDIDKAQELFQQIDADPVSAVYLARIARARQDGVLATHVWKLTEK